LNGRTAESEQSESHPTEVKTPAGVAVTLRGVERTFGGTVRAVDGIDLQISAGQFISLLGPSGCGKSTLLRMIAGLDRPDAGEIWIEGAANRSGNRSRAFVFQDAHLLPWRSVLRNVALPLELQGVDRGTRIAAARKVIAQVGLSDAEMRYPAQLSGGMKMRVSLARALVTEPELLLLDEPFAALDEITRSQLDLQLRELWLMRGMTVIFVTHSITEAAFLAERAIVFSKRPARIVLDHAVELPRERPNRLRGEAKFARQTGALLEALEQGGRP
jgi:NitT/TauT family transport system ATP-binding protein